MKTVIRKIDRALKRLYNIEHDFRAERFMISRPLVPSAARGALFIESQTEEALRVGIFLDESVKSRLTHFGNWNLAGWDIQKLGAWAVAAEEVSHFNYFLHHRSVGRAVSQLEMETQGEIDKFLLTYFVNYGKGGLIDKFEALLEQFFQRYHLLENLTSEQKGRYEEASRLAQDFLTKYRDQFADPRKVDKALRLLRRFYRASLSEKVSLARK